MLYLHVFFNDNHRKMMNIRIIAAMLAVSLITSVKRRI